MRRHSSSKSLKIIAVLSVAYLLYACGSSSDVDNTTTTTDTDQHTNSPTQQLSTNLNTQSSEDAPYVNPDSQHTATNFEASSKPLTKKPLTKKPLTEKPTDASQIHSAVPTEKPTKTSEPSKSPAPTVKTTTKPADATEKPSATSSKTDAPTKTPSKKPSSEVTIPTIKSVSAPGKTTYSNDDNTVIIDASNTSDGYVAIKYSGKNSKVKIIISKSSDKYTYNISTGDYVYYPLQMGNGSYNISIYENISGNEYMPVLQQDIDVSVKNEDDIFIYPNQFVWFTQSSNVVKQSGSLCSECNSDFEKVSAIFEYISSNISYDYNKASNVKSGYIPDVDSILSSKKGICFDYASLFAAMCRAQGIPTKLAIGYVNQNSTLIYHAWNYVYTKEKGWITVSFYLSKKGYNLVDATFYSSMNNKEEAADFISNTSNYQVYQYY